MSAARQYPNSFAAADTADTTLDGAILSTDTSLVVASLPAGVSAAPFPVKIDSEWLLVGAIGGTGNLTWSSLTRGYAGSSAAGHADAADVFLVLLGDDLVQVADGRSIKPADVTLAEEAAPASPASGASIIYTDSTTHHLTRKDSSGTVTDIETPAYGSLTGTPSTFAPSAHATSHEHGGSDVVSLTEAEISTSDVTTGNVSSAKHGFTPKSPADATQFLNGATTPAFAQVKDSDLSTSDVTTNNVSSTKHGFAPKSPADATQFLNGDATPAFAPVTDADLSTSDVTTNNVSTSKHGFTPKLDNNAAHFLDGTGAWSTPGGSANDFTYTEETTPASPAAGKQTTFIDSADHKLKRVNSSGGVTTIEGGSGVSSPLTTKGDVWGFSTVDARVPVGSDGAVLIADSGQTLGVRWGTPKPYLSGLNALTAPPSSGWTWDNQNGSSITTVTSDQGQTYEYMKAANQSGNKLCVRYRTPTGGYNTPLTITAAFLHNITGMPGDTAANNGGFLGFRDSGGKIVTIRWNFQAGVPAIQTDKWSSATSVSAAYTSRGPSALIGALIFTQPFWLRIKDDGTNLIYFTSIDGKTFEQFDSRARGDFLSTGPATVCWGAYADDGQPQIALISWAQS